MEPKFEVQLKIQRPVSEVFEAVVNPKKLSGYFVQEASGPLAEGTTVMWKFAEVPGEHPVKVRQVVKNDRIVFESGETFRGYDTKVEMLFKPLTAQATMVQIRESGWRDSPKDIESSYGNASGWTHMMCCLKAYLEHGINLRAGGAV
jgi:uncharacterized protein YndB with AHSA1/START domain